MTYILGQRSYSNRYSYCTCVFSTLFLVWRLIYNMVTIRFAETGKRVAEALSAESSRLCYTGTRFSIAVFHVGG